MADWIDDYMRKLRKIIAKHPAGIAVQGVGGNPPWCYTIGLLPQHGFEVIVFMLPMEHATAILNSIALSLKNGVAITPDVPMRDNQWIAGWPALFKRCEPDLLRDRVTQAQNYHGRDDFPVYQLVLCDRQGRFPGEAGYDLKGQPLMYHPESSTDARVLPMWTVYDHPSDHPAHWVARRWEVGMAGAVATSQLLKADSLDALRELLPPGLHCMPRAPGDDPNIVETWL